MKALLFAAAISVSGIAIAQDTNTQNSDQPAQGTEQPSGETVDDPSQSTGPQGITQQGTDPNGQATAPVGTNQPPTVTTGTGEPMASQQTSTPRPAAGEYPPCSRTVTDACIQTYERGVRRARRGR